MKYIRCHIVEARPMTRYAFDNLKNREHAGPNDEGYHVVYPDGYESWCPKAQFEKAGFPLDNGDCITEGDVRRFKLLGYKGVTTRCDPNDKPYTLVEMVYPTGFSDVDTSTCVVPENYSEEIGNEICAKRISNRLYAFLGFMLAWAKNGLRDIGMEICRRHDAEAANAGCLMSEAPSDAGIRPAE